MTGRETATDIKVHWVPGWIRDDFIRTCLQSYGTILSYRAETATVDGVRVFTGSKIIRLKTTPEVEATIPVAIEVSGPVTIRLLVTVRGRPPMCLNCFKLGHKQRDCPPENSDDNADTKDKDDNEDNKDMDDNATERNDDDNGSGDDSGSGSEGEDDEDDEDGMEVVPESEPHSSAIESHHDGTQDVVQPPPPPPPLMTEPQTVKDAPAAQDSPKPPECLAEDTPADEDVQAVQESLRSPVSTDEPATPKTLMIPLEMTEEELTDALTPTPPLVMDIEHPPWTTTPSPAIHPNPPSPTTSEIFLPKFAKPGPERPRSGSRSRQTTDQTPYARPVEDRRPRREPDRFRQTSTYQEAASKAEMSLSRFLNDKEKKTMRKNDNTEDAAPRYSHRQDSFEPYTASNGLPPTENRRKSPPRQVRIPLRDTVPTFTRRIQAMSGEQWRQDEFFILDILREINPDKASKIITNRQHWEAELDKASREEQEAYINERKTRIAREIAKWPAYVHAGKEVRQKAIERLRATPPP